MNTLNFFFSKYARSYQILAICAIVLMLFVQTSYVFGQKKNKKSKQEKTDTINMLSASNRFDVQLIFHKGDGHNHPTFAIWSQDMNGELLETLFVTQYFASGIFAHADAGEGVWEKESGESLRPAALPYWSHKRNIISRDTLYVPTPENPVPDALSGPTPKGNFVLNSSIRKNSPKKFWIMLEINQTWDWNDYWTNNKYPGNYNYKSSAQPSVVYAVEVDMDNLSSDPLKMEIIGHGHYAGDTGEMFKDTSTLSTALEIAKSIEIIIK